MKRTLAFLLVLTILLTFVACGTSETFDWNTIMVKEQLPQPTTNQGKIVTNDPNGLWMHVKATSISEYQTYVAACKEKGFTIEADEKTSSYYAYNDAGYKISLYYTESSAEYDINVDAPRKMSTITWPVTGIAATLPATPSTTGVIETDTSSSFVAYIGDMPVASLLEYINLCSESGYNVDYDKRDTYYKAFNGDGTKLVLTYMGFYTIRIELYAAKNSDTASSNQNATEPTDDTSTESSDDIGTEFKATMDSYEAFFDEYVELMKSYKSNPTDVNLALKAAEMATAYAENMEKLENLDTSNLNDAELAYYLEVTNRITQKLLSIA